MIQPIIISLSYTNQTISKSLDSLFREFPVKMKKFYDYINSSRKFANLAIFGTGHSAISIIRNSPSLDPASAIDENKLKSDRFLPRVNSVQLPIASLENAALKYNELDVLLATHPSSQQSISKRLLSTFSEDSRNIITTLQ